MSHVVLKKSAGEINKMKEFYQSKLIDKLPPGSVFAAKTPSCTITAYKSGKVLFQGAGSSAEAERWGGVDESSAPARSATVKTKNIAGADLLPNFGNLSVIGSDEVGTGDFFGPITVVAAYVRQQDMALLKELGVRDSKDLNDEKISAIAKQIKDVIPYSLLTLHNEKYNKLQQSGMSQGKLKALLHNQAIGHVLNKISPEKPNAILIDQFAKKDIYYGYLKNEAVVQRENVYFSTKAEGIHLSVAAASILARYAFIRHFEKLSEMAGFTIPKGAGAQVDVACAKLIQAKGEAALPQFVKMHFANREKALEILRRKRGV